MSLFNKVEMDLASVILGHLSVRVVTMSLEEIVRYSVKETLKQVAHDCADLEYSVLKGQYAAPVGTTPPAPVVETARTKTPPAPVKAKAPKAVKAKAAPKELFPEVAPKKSYSKMKKDDLVKECELLGLSSDGTVPQLRARLKSPDTQEIVVAPKKSKSKKGKPVHTHALTEEAVDGCEVCHTYGNRVVGDDFEDEEDAIRQSEILQQALEVTLISARDASYADWEG
jgi:hypothetical protein